MSDWAYTVIGTNVVIDCGTVEEATAYERELWMNQPDAPTPPDALLSAIADVDAALVEEFAGTDDLVWHAWDAVKEAALAGVTLAPTPPDALGVFWDEKAHIVPAYDSQGNLERRVDEYAPTPPGALREAAEQYREAVRRRDPEAMQHIASRIVYRLIPALAATEEE